MKIDTFLTLYKNKKTEDDRVDFLKSHVVDKYVPLEEKQVRAQNIVKSSYYQKDKDGNEKFHCNSVAKYMLTGLSMISMYTDIELNENTSLEDFNKLNEAKVLDDFIAAIDDNEWSEFIQVLDMEEKDLFQNEFSVTGYIDRQVERFSDLITTLLPLLQDMDINNIKESMNDIINK